MLLLARVWALGADKVSRHVHIPALQGDKGRVARSPGKQDIWFLLIPYRENAGNFAVAQGKF